MKRTTTHTISVCPLRFAMAMAITTSGTLAAVDSTWTGLAGDGQYATAGNWTGTPNQPPSFDGTGTFADGGNGFTTITIDAGRSVAALAFTTNAASYTIGSAGANAGPTLTLAAAGNNRIDNTVVGTNLTQTINAPLLLSGASSTFTNNSTSNTNSFHIAGDITTANAAATQLTLAGSATGGINTVGGTISKGVGTASFGINVTGGKWLLSSASNAFDLMPTTVTIDTVVYNRGMSIGAATIIIGANSTGGSGTAIAPVTSGPLGTGSVHIGNASAVLEAGGADRTIGNTLLLGNNNWSTNGSHSLTLNGLMIFGGGNTVNNNIIAADKRLTIGGDIHIRDNPTLSARTITFGGNGTTVIGGTISNGVGGNPGHLTIGVAGGTGTVKLTGANTYTGNTNITAGATLLVNGTHSVATVGGYTVTGTLGGTGVITPSGTNAVTVKANTGKLSPGDSTLVAASQIGTMEIGKLAFEAAATYSAQLGGTTPGDGAGSYDQVNVTTTAAGGLAINPATVLDLSLVAGFAPSSSAVFYILTRADASATAVFSGLPEGATITLPLGTAQITYQAHWTGAQATSTLTGGNDVAIYNVVVPEPATLALLASAAGLLLRRRRAA